MDFQFGEAPFRYVLTELLGSSERITAAFSFVFEYDIIILIRNYPLLSRIISERVRREPFALRRELHG